MPLYKMENSQLIISNLKVMSSSLNNTKDLKRLNRPLFLGWYLKNIFSNTQKIMFVRNPYKRVISVYNSKFLSIEKYKKQGLQQIHYLFMSQLGLSENMDEVTKIFKNLTFEKYLDILEKVYKEDPHTIPQHRILRTYFLNANNIKLVKIEDKHAMEDTLEILGLSIPKKNRAKHIELELSSSQRKLIQKMYKKDFTELGYIM